MTKKTTRKTIPKGKNVPKNGVRVRMYRHGFGDFFLLSFGRGDQSPFHMVIDCGLLMNAPSPDRLREAVQHVSDETGGALDVVVCTHEHVDHLSGFLHADQTWKAMSIRDLWFAWTEDPGDAVANALREQRERRKQGLRATQPRLSAAPGARGAAEEVEAALSFFGATGSKSDTRAALDLVRERCSGRPRYLRPGRVAEHAALPGVRFFVLGPPTDEALLKKDKPSSKTPEVYHAGGALTADAAFFAAAATGDLPDVEESTRAERSSPFEAAFWIDARRVEKAGPRADDDAQRLHASYYAPTGLEVDVRYKQGELERVTWRSEQAWRRIDDDWLGLAGPLAMKLDEDTNNTSLVLAIELPKSQHVLLFPGDAQVGNWLSWDSHEFKVRAADGSERKVTATDLLARTVVYKVGHHGSHNATMKEKGLERMTSKRLVAMIPVDEATAKQQGRKGRDGKPKGWAMPFKPLLDALEDHASGRVLRADGRTTPRARKKAAREAWFKRATKTTPLFIDLVIEDE